MKNPLNKIWCFLRRRQVANTINPVISRTSNTAIQAKIDLSKELLNQKNYQDAIDILQHAVALDPSNAETHNLLGLAYIEIAKFSEAIQAFQTAIAFNPADYRYHMNIGVCYFKQEKYAAALHMCEYADSMQPNNAIIYLNKGAALLNLEKLTESIDVLEKAIELDPQSLTAYLNLATAYINNAQPAKAVALLKNACKIEPDNLKAQLHFALSLQSDDKIKESIQHYEAIKAKHPNKSEMIDLYWNCAIANLKIGNFSKGWEDYELRWHLNLIKNAYYTLRYAAYPKWQYGQLIKGKKLLIFCEQGFGDALHFIRYVPLLVDLGAIIIVDTCKELIQLFRSIPGITKLFTNDEVIPEFDLCCSILSIPRLLNTTLETIPANIPYLFSEAKLKSRWKQRVLHNNKLRVGLVWSGSDGRASRSVQYIKAFERRNVTLEKCIAWSKLANVQLYSLQKGKPAEEIKQIAPLPNIIDFTAELEDFADTAALIDNLDLVIGVDTAVIHLSGALGKPTWLLDRFAGCWRWLLDREDSPWYPTMRIFKQEVINDWDSVIEKITVELRKLAAETAKQNEPSVEKLIEIA